MEQQRDEEAFARVVAEKLSPVEFPRSASYDAKWVLENLMGPNVLWLAESLSEVLELRPGMRVLDMGCGKAISSIFLAKEFGVQVWATDLWIPAAENGLRIRAAGVEDSVCPIHAEAHALPFAEGFFDALVSLVRKEGQWHFKDANGDDLGLSWSEPSFAELAQAALEPK